MKKFIKDVILKDFGQNKARAKQRHERKAGKRNYNSENWKNLCYTKSSQ